MSIRILFIYLFVVLSIGFAGSTERFIFKEFNLETISKESHPKVHATISVASKLVLPDPSEARHFFLEALRMVSRGFAIDKYDYLQSQYSLLKLARLGRETKWERQTQRDYDFIAKNLLVFLDYQGEMYTWKQTDMGMFQREAYKEASNRLAWNQMEDNKKLVESLAIIRKAKRFIDDEDDYYIYDTEVRILLKLKYYNRAYRIVAKVLQKKSNFLDFQDIKNSIAYKKWRR